MFNNVHIWICRLLRLEDSLRGHRFYFKTAELAVEVSLVNNADWSQNTASLCFTLVPFVTWVLAIFMLKLSLIPLVRVAKQVENEAVIFSSFKIVQTLSGNIIFQLRYIFFFISYCKKLLSKIIKITRSSYQKWNAALGLAVGTISCRKFSVIYPPSPIASLSLIRRSETRVVEHAQWRLQPVSRPPPPFPPGFANRY